MRALSLLNLSFVLKVPSLLKIWLPSNWFSSDLSNILTQNWLRICWSSPSEAKPTSDLKNFLCSRFLRTRQSFALAIWITTLVPFRFTIISSISLVYPMLMTRSVVSALCFNLHEQPTSFATRSSSIRVWLTSPRRHTVPGPGWPATTYPTFKIIFCEVTDIPQLENR